MKTTPYGILLMLMILTISCQENKKKKAKEFHPKTYKMHKATSEIVVDGVLEEAWEKAVVKDFNNFYAAEKSHDKQNTKFRMLWDEEFLYLFYECQDQFITAREKERDGAPYFDDCAEFFLSPTAEPIGVHFGFELNLYKTANDFVFVNDFYEGVFGSIKGLNPAYETEITINGTLNDNSDIDTGWTMEMAIPISVFKGVTKFEPVQKGSRWTFLALRQDRNDATGDRRVTSTIFPIESEEAVHDANQFSWLEFVEE
ncbi:carbohydrate-binding family 9-like protein [Flavicella sediminum]|uniref:carbohydrate-binding family 9-like protein n=1 Tax=Flavicella sediminum TaxID=2585141 RepID=UPI00111E4F02|nr:carbohydrate-binding family 9-like protein [Flavicella sediminum]